jgi:ATP-dependent RNA helicase DDX54/DBP10
VRLHNHQPLSVDGLTAAPVGLHPWLLRSLTLQGYRVPTPIQRLAIPSLMANPPRDLVGMARTGSGKSLAYMVPLVQRLGGRHSTTFGARALILLPTRELALQLLKVGKELARGWHAGEGDHAGEKHDGDSKRSQGLRWALVVGGEGMDEQFEMISGNPDVYVPPVALSYPRTNDIASL